MISNLHFLYLQIELSFFDPSSSSTTSLVSCSHPICTSLVQTTAAECSPQSNQCSYSFHYGDGSGTTGYYVSDMLYFDTVLGDSLIANSSASIVFGWAVMTCIEIWCIWCGIKQYQRREKISRRIKEQIHLKNTSTKFFPNNNYYVGTITSIRVSWLLVRIYNKNCKVTLHWLTEHRVIGVISSLAWSLPKVPIIALVIALENDY